MTMTADIDRTDIDRRKAKNIHTSDKSVLFSSVKLVTMQRTVSSRVLNNE